MRNKTTFQLTVALLTLICTTLGGTSLALADAIDGAWCSPDGKHLAIAGRNITTPGGAKLEGNYTRHAFSYVAPSPEFGAGETIFMQLVNETTVLVRVGSPVGQPITWKRCENIT